MACRVVGVRTIIRSARQLRKPREGLEGVAHSSAVESQYFLHNVSRCEDYEGRPDPKAPAQSA